MNGTYQVVGWSVRDKSTTDELGPLFMDAKNPYYINQKGEIKPMNPDTMYIWKDVIEVENVTPK